MRPLPDAAASDVTGDVHIASFIVHATPAQVMNVAASVAEMPGAEVHAATSGTWDLGFLASGIVLMAAGALLARTGRAAYPGLHEPIPVS